MRATEFILEADARVTKKAANPAAEVNPESNFGTAVQNALGSAIKNSPIGSAIDTVDAIRKGDVGGAVGSAVGGVGKTAGYAMGGLPGLAVGTAVDAAGNAIKKTTAKESCRQKNISEASGHIPKNDQEAKDPRYSNALTVDIHPGEDAKQAAKLGFGLTDGKPPKLKTNGKI
jgi:hypothetical protein